MSGIHRIQFPRRRSLAGADTNPANAAQRQLL